MTVSKDYSHWIHLAGANIAIPETGMPEDYSTYYYDLLLKYLDWKYGCTIEKGEDHPLNCFVRRFLLAKSVRDTIFIEKSIELAFEREVEWRDVFQLENDRLAYILTASGCTNYQQYLKDLRCETQKAMTYAVAATRTLDGGKEGAVSQRFKPILQWALDSNDVQAKHFLILVALFLEPEYYKQWNSSSSGWRIECFKDDLIKAFNKLRLGKLSGLAEFIYEVRPLYIMDI